MNIEFKYEEFEDKESYVYLRQNQLDVGVLYFCLSTRQLLLIASNKDWIVWSENDPAPVVYEGYHPPQQG